MNRQVSAKAFTPPDKRIRLLLSGRSRSYDARTSAIRLDLADIAASTFHLAPHYAAAVAYVCAAPSVMLRASPDTGASAVTQILHGETFQVLDLCAGWAWGYCAHDHYVGYVPAAALARSTGAPRAWRVAASGAILFSQADIKSAAIGTLPGGSMTGGAMTGDFLATDAGFLHCRHVRSVTEVSRDWVEIARGYLGMGYLWGGRGDGGIDCSGLVQMALAACGIAAERDSDQQAVSIGRPLADDESLQRGDVVFFPGHVGLMSDEHGLIHANAHWMRVVEEPLSDVVARLSATHPAPVIARRRIEP